MVLHAAVGLSQQYISNNINNLGFSRGWTGNILALEAGLYKQFAFDDKVVFLVGGSVRRRGHTKDVRPAPIGDTSIYTLDLRQIFVGIEGGARAYIFDDPKKSFRPFITGGLRLDFRAQQTSEFNYKSGPRTTLGREDQMEGIYTTFAGEYNMTILGSQVGVGLDYGPVIVELIWQPDLSPAYRVAERGVDGAVQYARNNAILFRFGIKMG